MGKNPLLASLGKAVTAAIFFNGLDLIYTFRDWLFPAETVILMSSLLLFFTAVVQAYMAYYFIRMTASTLASFSKVASAGSSAGGGNPAMMAFVLRSTKLLGINGV